ncbi:MAG TPA: TonB-dependent receptor plug domain-containing protein [Woeseiaceae bacterium]|nr:TonB-dependent receptor plug domain-containing protein [Woeseiaceae bacterium]
MLPSMFPRRLVLAAVAFPFVHPALALAQDSGDAEIEEIIVTADFRERPASELPTSVTVLEHDAIDELAVQHFEELITVIPNVNFSGEGNRARFFQIRGVGELEQYEGAPNPSVGFLIDDIDFSGIGGVATLFDIDHVEVLRGPQGTRYGANAIGGLIYLRSTAPTEEWSGLVELGAGTDDALSGGVAFGGPITEGDALSFRVSAHHHESDGFRDNAFLHRDDTNGRDETTFRGKLLWDAPHDWRALWTTMLADVDDGYDAFAIDNSLTVLSDHPGRDAQRSLGSSLRLEWEGAGGFAFTSITSAADSDRHFAFDADWGNPEAWAPFTYDFISVNHRERQTLSQELRLASTEGGRIFNGTTDWLVGAYLLDLDETLSTLNRGEYFDPLSGFADSLDDTLASRFEATNTALFGQLGIEVGEAGEIDFGLRVETRRTDYADSNGLRLDPDETMIGGELSYSHDFSDAVTGFVALSRGYKAGGFNLGPVPAGGRQFDQESLWSLETGVKALLLDGSLAFDGTVFYSRRNDQQVRTSVQLNPNDPASFIFFTDNAAKGRSIGAEAQFRWLPSDAWELYASVGLLDAEFEEFSSEAFDLSGRDQAHAPNYTLALGGAYRHPSGLFARLDLSARDAFYFDVSHNQRSEPYALARARLGYETERWSAELWVRNLLDETYAVRGFFFGNEPPDFANELYIRRGDPRQLGVTIEMRF